MAYKTIFGIKPKKENKIEFCRRIVSLLNDIAFCSDNYRYNDGKRMIDNMFKYNKLNNGYVDIDDLLSEADVPYANIFDIVNMERSSIIEEEILVNIDLIINCLAGFEKSNDRYFFSELKANENISIIFSAIKEYLLKCGYRLFYDEDKDQFFIIENEISIDIEEITEEKIKSEIINFYDYRNSKDINEKKKIMLILIGDLESRKKDIEKLMGSKIADTFSNYANNFNLRHNNICEEYKKYYNKTIAEMNKEEILRWYDYIFAFMINIYLSLDKLKDVNINNGYK